MQPLRIQVLGTPQVTVGEQPLQVDTRKATAMLVYLAVSGSGHNREHLAALLWPEFDQTRARAALRRTLSTLKQGLGDGWLRIEGDFIELTSSPDLGLDTAQFEGQFAALASHNLDQHPTCPRCVELMVAALEIYRGDFLAGFSLRDSAPFDEWQFFQTEAFRRKAETALEIVVAGLAAQRDFSSAIDFGHRWLALDPLRELVHQQLMRLYAWAGQRNAALRQYRECVRILDQELGVLPLEETAALYQDILEGRQPPLPPPPTRDVRQPAGVEARPMAVPPEGVRSLPMVGRETVFKSLLDSYQAVGEAGRLVVLEGEPGIGKTRLATEFLEHIRTGGAQVLSMRTYEGETHLALGPFIEGFRRAMGRLDPQSWAQGFSTLNLWETARLLPEISQMVPELTPAPVLDGPGAQSRFHEALRQLVLALCRGPLPGVVFVDDVHWADEASLDLLSYLVRRLDNMTVLVLISWRPEAVSADHHLRRILAEVRRSGFGALVSLGRLSAGEVEKLCRARFQDPPDRDVISRLVDETEGLPQFVIAYLEALADAERGPSSFDWSLPGGVRDLLRLRLDGIQGAPRQLLTAAAVIGRAFEVDLLQAVSGRSMEEAVVGLEDLLARDLFRELDKPETAGSPGYAFSHELIQSLVYEETSLARRRLLHHRAAEALEQRAHGHQEQGLRAGQIAYHFHHAGLNERAAVFYQQAGNHAQSLFANREAIAHFQSALGLGASDPSALHEAIGDLQTRLGSYRLALNSYARADALRDELSPPRLDHKMGLVHQHLGEWESAEGYYKVAENKLGEAGPAEALARLLSDWSLVAYRKGLNDQAEALARRALAYAERVGGGRAQAQVRNVMGILARAAGEYSTAKDHFTSSLSFSETQADPGPRVAALNNLALVHLDLGEITQAQDLLEQALAFCTALGDRHRQAALHNNLADLLHRSGQEELAMDHLKQAVILFAEIGEAVGGLQPEIWKLVEW